MPILLNAKFNIIKNQINCLKVKQGFVSLVNSFSSYNKSAFKKGFGKFKPALHFAKNKKGERIGFKFSKMTKSWLILRRSFSYNVLKDLFCKKQKNQSVNLFLNLSLSNLLAERRTILKMRNKSKMVKLNKDNKDACVKRLKPKKVLTFRDKLSLLFCKYGQESSKFIFSKVLLSQFSYPTSFALKFKNLRHVCSFLSGRLRSSMYKYVKSKIFKYKAKKLKEKELNIHNKREKRFLKRLERTDDFLKSYSSNQYLLNRQILLDSDASLLYNKEEYQESYGKSNILVLRITVRENNIFGIIRLDSPFAAENVGNLGVRESLVTVGSYTSEKMGYHTTNKELPNVFPTFLTKMCTLLKEVYQDFPEVRTLLFEFAMPEKYRHPAAHIITDEFPKAFLKNLNLVFHFEHKLSFNGCRVRNPNSLYFSKGLASENPDIEHENEF